MEGGYVNIQLKWLSEWRLSPAEAVVYGYLYGWLKGQAAMPFKQTQAEMAKALGFKERTFKGVLGGLIEKGCVEIVRSARATYRLNDGVLYNIVESAKSAHCAKSAQSANIAQTKCKNCTSESAKSALSTFSNINNNISSNIIDDEARVRTRIIKKGEQQPEQQQPLGSEAVVLSVDELNAEMRTELEQGARWAESAMRLHHITGSQLAAALNTFADTLTAAGTTVKSRGDYRKHFSNWLRIQVQTKQLDNNNGTRQSKPDTLPGTTISREYIERQLAIIANATKR